MGGFGGQGQRAACQPWLRRSGRRDFGIGEFGVKTLHRTRLMSVMAVLSNITLLLGGHRFGAPSLPMLILPFHVVGVVLLFVIS